MTRHGKNCTAGAVYTYHEKKKDTAASGYGTQNIRLSRDAVKDFDCCCLSLQPCHDPVVTPDGYLYEREAILEYILHQKKEIARQMKVAPPVPMSSTQPGGHVGGPHEHPSLSLLPPHSAGWPRVVWNCSTAQATAVRQAGLSSGHGFTSPVLTHCPSIDMGSSAFP
uniref:Nitric oxide synthase-interacting protein n=1 Tax=Homo sapiens TaxID=9606 RepID=B4DUN3_HUMAN|nr:unnamed protein product [Homo sapiens]